MTGDGSGATHANLSLPLDAMIRTAAPDASQAIVQQLSSAFRWHYDAGDWQTAEVYPHAEESLQSLEAARVRTFIVTNKRGVAARRLLEHFNLARYFEGVAGQPESGVPVPKQIWRTVAGGHGARSSDDSRGRGLRPGRLDGGIPTTDIHRHHIWGRTIDSGISRSEQGRNG